MERAGAEVFEKLPVGQAVRRQIVPSVVSQMVTLIYSLADTYFVGLLNEPRQSAAITLVYPSFVMLTAVSNLFGAGGASLIAQRLGKNKEKDAREISSAAFWLGLGAAVFFALLFFSLARPVLTLCGATEETFPIAHGYALWVIVLGGPFVILNSLLANLLRAEGLSAPAMFGTVTGAVVNMLLDPIFISGLGLGAAGAAYATVLGNLVTDGIYIYILLKKSRCLSLHPKYFYVTIPVLGQILSIGIPGCTTNLMNSISMALTNQFLLAYGNIPVAAMGIVLITCCTFQAAGKAAGAFCLSVSRQGAVFAAVLFVMSRTAGYDGVILSQTISDVITAGMAAVLFRVHSIFPFGSVSA